MSTLKQKKTGCFKHVKKISQLLKYAKVQHFVKNFIQTLRNEVIA